MTSSAGPDSIHAGAFGSGQRLGLRRVQRAHPEPGLTGRVGRAERDAAAVTRNGNGGKRRLGGRCQRELDQLLVTR
jgi:hypothetical protein